MTGGPQNRTKCENQIVSKEITVFQESSQKITYLRNVKTWLFHYSHLDFHEGLGAPKPARGFGFRHSGRFRGVPVPIGFLAVPSGLTWASPEVFFDPIF